MATKEAAAKLAAAEETLEAEARHVPNAAHTDAPAELVVVASSGEYRKEIGRAAQSLTASRI